MMEDGLVDNILNSLGIEETDYCVIQVQNKKAYTSWIPTNGGRLRYNFIQNKSCQELSTSEYLIIKDDQTDTDDSKFGDGQLDEFEPTTYTLIKKDSDNFKGNILISLNVNDNKHPILANYSFTLESYGIIKIQIDEFYINKAVILENIDNTTEYLIHFTQFAVTQIKKAIHGHNHHHSKDDTIMRIIPSEEFTHSNILEQLSYHSKVLEHSEKKRTNWPCHEYIPSYYYDIQGVHAYAKQYFRYYFDERTYEGKLYETQSKQEDYAKAKTLLCGIENILSSTNVSYLRTNELKVIQKEKQASKSKTSLAILFPLLIIFWSMSSFYDSLLITNKVDEVIKVVVSQQVNQGLKSATYTTEVPTTPNSYEYMSGFLQYIHSLSGWTVIILFIFLMMAIYVSYIKRCVCFDTILHTDGRPKDRIMTILQSTISITEKIKMLCYDKKIKSSLTFKLYILSVVYIILSIIYEILI